MAVQPQGTVTLLFSDIEGPTRLLQELGRERYAEALAAHHSGDALTAPAASAGASVADPVKHARAPVR